MEDGYPVVEERILEPATSNRFGLRRRDLDALPPRRPGATLVFDVDGGYQPRPATGRLRPTERHIVAATAVALVDMRPRTVGVRFPVASPLPDRDFSVRVEFGCRVLDAAVVAQQGLADLVPLLLAQLGQDNRVRWLATEYSPDQLTEATRQVHRRVVAQLSLTPPVIHGMDIHLIQAQIDLEGTGA